MVYKIIHEYADAEEHEPAENVGGVVPDIGLWTVPFTAGTVLHLGAGGLKGTNQDAQRDHNGEKNIVPVRPVPIHGVDAHGNGVERGKDFTERPKAVETECADAHAQDHGRKYDVIDHGIRPFFSANCRIFFLSGPVRLRVSRTPTEASLRFALPKEAFALPLPDVAMR